MLRKGMLCAPCSLRTRQRKSEEVAKGSEHGNKASSSKAMRTAESGIC